MKRALTAAAALLICASSAAAQDKDKKDKDRTPPSATQAAKAAKPDRSVPATPRPLRTEPPAHPAFVQPTPRMAPPAVQPQPKFERPTRPDNTVAVKPADRPVRPDRVQTRPERGATVTASPKPDKPASILARPAHPLKDAGSPGHAPRPPRGDKPRPVIADAPRPRPPHSALPTKPTRAARPAKAATPRAIARSRQIRLTLRTNRVRTYSYRGRTLRAVKVRPYAYPAGFRYRAWRKHQHFPAALFLAPFFLTNFFDYGLSAPPSGYYWVRYGPDAVLVNRGSYDIADTAYGVFDDGSGYGGGYNDGADLPPIDEDMPQDFATGQLDLAAGVDQSDACRFFYADQQTQDDIDRAWADQDWNGLAKTVVWAGCGNDVSYYLLGLAAEGLALPDAAASFYGQAVELADGDADSTFKCAISGPDACRGLDIGNEASDGLDRIYGPAN